MAVLNFPADKSIVYERGRYTREERQRIKDALVKAFSKDELVRLRMELLNIRREGKIH